MMDSTQKPDPPHEQGKPRSDPAGPFLFDRLRDLADSEPRVQASLDHLQRAAREAIAASRALLDVAEDLVEDPRVAAGLLDFLGTVGDLAGRMTRVGGIGDAWVDTDESDDGEPPIQRIPVS